MLPCILAVCNSACNLDKPMSGSVCPGKAIIDENLPPNKSISASSARSGKPFCGTDVCLGELVSGTNFHPSKAISSSVCSSKPVKAINQVNQFNGNCSCKTISASNVCASKPICTSNVCSSKYISVSLSK